MLDQLAPWITPAIVLALFVWLRSDIRDLRHELGEMRRDLKAVETGLAELRGRFDGIDGQFAFLRDYITGENVRGQRPTEAGADE